MIRPTVTCFSCDNAPNTIQLEREVRIQWIFACDGPMLMALLLDLVYVIYYWDEDDLGWNNETIALGFRSVFIYVVGCLDVCFPTSRWQSRKKNVSLYFWSRCALTAHNTPAPLHVSPSLIGQYGNVCRLFVRQHSICRSNQGKAAQTCEGYDCL